MPGAAPDAAHGPRRAGATIGRPSIGADVAMTQPTPAPPPPDRDSADVPPPRHDSADLPPPRQATLWQIVVAVFWSFFGVRKGNAMRQDLVTIKPHQVIIVGILVAAGLVVALLILVRLITRNA